MFVQIGAHSNFNSPNISSSNSNSQQESSSTSSSASTYTSTLTLAKQLTNSSKAEKEAEDFESRETHKAENSISSEEVLHFPKNLLKFLCSKVAVGGVGERCKVSLSNVATAAEAEMVVPTATQTAASLHCKGKFFPSSFYFIFCSCFMEFSHFKFEIFWIFYGLLDTTKV